MMLWKDFTTDEINKKIQRENVIHLAIEAATKKSTKHYPDKLSLVPWVFQRTGAKHPN
jgi:hypothetical protein